MTRKNKEDTPEKSAQQALDLLKIVIDESERTANMTAKEYFDDFHKRNPNLIMPTMVNGCYMTSDESRAIEKWARFTRQLDDKALKEIDESSWEEAVKYSYVSIDLRSTNLPVTELQTFLGVEITKLAKSLVEKSIKRRTHYFPCYLFESQKLKNIIIGDVCFFTGDQLVEKITAECGDEPDWVADYRRIQADPSLPADSTFRNNALTVWRISRQPWIASVLTIRSDIRMSRRRAQDAARLTIAGIGLLLSSSQCRDIALTHEWGTPSVVHTISQTQGSDVTIGHRGISPQIRSDGSLVRELIDSQADYLDWIGECIKEAILVDENKPLELRRSWLNALYWYYAGCREASDARATISFSSALESLADGIGAANILHMTEIVLRTDRSKILAKEKQWTLKRTIEAIYSESRSEVVHGGRFVVTEEYHYVRSVASELCQYVLLTYQELMQSFEQKYNRKAEADSKATFLKWAATSSK